MVSGNAGCMRPEFIVVTKASPPLCMNYSLMTWKVVLFKNVFSWLWRMMGIFCRVVATEILSLALHASLAL